MNQSLLFDRIEVERKGLTTRPIILREAQAFIRKHHRHNRPPRGCKFCVAVMHQDQMVGVLVVGRPTARAYDDGLTAEVTRTCTINCRNANSYLYGLARKISTLLGYKRLVTYTRDGESGASLRASGFTMIAVREPRKNWKNSSVKRVDWNEDDEEYVTRYLWEARL